jgi:hypothetical protein
VNSLPVVKWTLLTLLDLYSVFIFEVHFSTYVMGGIEALLAALVIIFLLRSYFTKPKLPHGVQLPPGPPLIPLIGNALAVDVSAPWVTYKTWGSQYGK